MKYSLLTVTLACFLALSLAHSTKYLGVNRNEACLNPEPATVYSYHIHLLYWQTNKEHTEGAYRIRDAFR